MTHYIARAVHGVEAVRWSGSAFSEVPLWLYAALTGVRGASGTVKPVNTVVQLAADVGYDVVKPGGYLIRDAAGNLSAMEETVFKQIYRRAA